ncbi:hypothetical protein PGTUg99_003187 [Puccinia graminis f. sp. tritici]|uniref:Uncharacterized protein n=1 Tax=Puccinia graminis f. sp. tritici TaxID=56615 RepID=A0A5B0RPB4_PUCGR|nr:hypothetical protein PGTUg99_003187 [Puccinia graminis f. sp. tritici]
MSLNTINSSSGGNPTDHQNQENSAVPMFTLQNVQEMISSALSRQAESLNPAFQLMQKEIEALKLNNAPNSPVTQTSNPTISKNQSETKKKPTPPVNKRNKLVAQAIRTSQRQKSQRAQSEPPSTTSKTLAKKKAGPRASTSPKKIPKKKPSQMVTEDFPPDFQATKKIMQECLYVHIRLLWGLVETSSVPPQANKEHIRSFCTKFSTVDQVQRHFEDSHAAHLIARSDILTLKDARAGKIKVGQNLIHIDDGHIVYIHANLAKLGIRCWGPNLDEGPESLFNSACRIAALTGFQQIAIAGAYNFLNFDHKYKDDMLLFIRAYNHYVHHVLAQKYHAECKKPGSNQESIKVHKASTNRRRRYTRIIEDVASHSDDEWDGERECFAIKTLGYRSNSANIFFRRLDLAMKAVKVATGKTSRMRLRKLPAIPIISSFSKVPQQLPLDFYARKWISELPTGQQRIIPDLSSVAFLHDPSKSLFARNHPDYDKDEKLSDRAFNKKYLDKAIKQYRMKEIVEEEETDSDDDPVEEEDDEDANTQGEQVDPETKRDETYLSDGDWGNQYDEEEGESDEEGEDEDEDMEDNEKEGIDENYEEFDDVEV